jgi:S-adenosylmethionine hydrolase
VADLEAFKDALPISPRPRRVALLTDFGAGPYVGQMQLLLSALAPGVPSVALISNLPAFRPELAAYLLPRLRRGMPGGTVYTCVVDPGVGTDREALAVNSGEDWWVGPDNGLLVPLLKGLDDARVFRICWRPEQLSASFHGRDLFLPVAASLTRGVLLNSAPTNQAGLANASWPEAAWRVCYIDAFGNLMTGVPADQVSNSMTLRIGGHALRSARTFAEVPVGAAFWYRNAFDLVEIAVNQGRADEALSCELGDDVRPERTVGAG